jgi:Malectin domain/IPT/TIG domain
MADKYFSDGYDIDGELRKIEKTDQDQLYSSHRAFCCGGGGYSIPVPDGTYTVILMFADVRFTEKNERVFKLFLQGKLIIPNLDIFDEVGTDTAYRLLNVVTVDNGMIDIEFETVIENAMVNAIEILPGEQTFAPTRDPLGEFQPIRINAGSREEYIDPETNYVWGPDRFSTDGDNFDVCPFDIKDTNKDALFCAHRSFPGLFNSIGTYKIPVQKGLYTVNLLFAETFSKYKRDRMFNVIVQGVMVAENLDLIAEVGNFTAYSITTIATVTPVSKINYITIEIVNVIGDGLISAIEILEYTPPPTTAPPPPPVVRINCGHDASYTDSAGNVWMPDTNYTNGMSSSKIVDDVLGTSDDILYFHERVGDPVAYNFTLPAGVYQVTLFFVETKFTEVGDRVMDIQLGDTILKKGYDILAAAAPETSTSLRFFHMVDKGILNITLSKSLIVTSSAPPKLNAIEILLDAPHMSHAVARGPYYSTVSDESGKATIQLNGEASHTHGQGLLVTEAEWTEGDMVLGKYLNLDYDFPPGEHTVVLAIKDSGGHEDTETTTVSIRPYGFPTITEILPNTGSIEGGYEITIKGAGFTDDADNTFVDFGFTNFTGSSLDVVDEFTIKITSPKVKFAQQVPVVVQTTKAKSEVALFDYVGSVPIMWTSGNLFSIVAPSVGRFGPDRKLYVGTTKGVILKMTFNDDFTQATNTITVEVNQDKNFM